MHIFAQTTLDRYPPFLGNLAQKCWEMHQNHTASGHAFHPCQRLFTYSSNYQVVAN